jgi:sec-independent protein translocase protein TatB
VPGFLVRFCSPGHYFVVGLLINRRSQRDCYLKSIAKVKEDYNSLRTTQNIQGTMNLFGIGPLELLLILLVALIIFGPNDIQKAGKAIGRTLNKIVRSDSWRAITQTSKELKTLPNRLMRESGLEELDEITKKELSKTGAELKPPILNEPTILPGPAPQPAKPADSDQPAPPKPDGNPDA